MSEKGYRKRRRFVNKLTKLVLLTVVFLVLAAIILGIVNIIGLFFGGFPVVDRILGAMAYGADFVFACISYILSYPFVLPIVGALIAVFLLFKVFVRGYWSLITRPWVILTSAVTLAAVIWIWNTFHPGFMTYCAFIVSGLFAMVEVILRAFSSLVPETSAKIAEILYGMGNLYYSISYYIYPVTTWFAGLFIMSRLTVMFSSSYSYSEIIDDIPALKLADSVTDEARKLTHRIPRHIIFYVQRGEGINACAFDHNKVAMTEELMKCDEEVIRAVIGHELGHIANKDVTAGLISGSNVKLICGLFTIPYFLLYGQSDKNNNVSVGPFVFVLIFLALFGAVINYFVNLAHYVCYIFGGKRCEYKADLFSTKLGYGVGLLDFMLSFYEAPSGGIKDPHPSMKNRIVHICDYITKHPKKYNEAVIDIAKRLKKDPDRCYKEFIAQQA